MDGSGIDAGGAAIFRLSCGCFVSKTPHAVANSNRKGTPTWARCPEHGPFTRRQTKDGRMVRVGQASALAMRARAVLCEQAGLVCQTGTIPVVWEARVLAGKLGRGNKAFDFWIVGLDVVVEVDGTQHTDTPYHKRMAGQQLSRDLAYTREAIQAGFMVVRLHEYDEARWCETVADALKEAGKGAGRFRWLHLTQHYLRHHPAWLDLWLTSHGPLGLSGGPGWV